MVRSCFENCVDKERHEVVGGGVRFCVAKIACEERSIELSWTAEFGCYTKYYFAAVQDADDLIPRRSVAFDLDQF